MALYSRSRGGGDIMKMRRLQLTHVLPGTNHTGPTICRAHLLPAV